MQNYTTQSKTFQQYNNQFLFIHAQLLLVSLETCNMLLVTYNFDMMNWLTQARPNYGWQPECFSGLGTNTCSVQ